MANSFAAMKQNRQSQIEKLSSEVKSSKVLEHPKEMIGFGNQR